MAKQVRIFQPSKTAMQSGKGKTHSWRMEFITDDSLAPDALMGWATMHDTSRQIVLNFASKDEAIAYAKAKNYVYEVNDPHSASVPPKAYAENFSFTRRKTTA